MNFRTISDLNRTIFLHLHEIPKDVDIIAGIPRSGLLAANIIALYLNLPLTDIDSLAESRVYPTGRTRRKDNWVKDIHEARKILVVDDSSYNGYAIKEARERLSATDFYDKLIFMAIYIAPNAEKFPDLYFEVVERQRMFEWNYFHRTENCNSCFDIDGVLCPNPTKEQDDDGAQYVDFIRNVPARLIPTFEIGCLITARLEKYRADTEYWLRKNNIRYRKLIMMNFATKEERLRGGSHGRFKAKHYASFRDSDIFIESNEAQAEEIAALTGKSVFCTDTQEFFPESTTRKVKREAQRRARTIVGRTRHLIGMMLPPKIKAAIKHLMHI